MTSVQHVAAFYSHGPHFRRVLKDARDRFPDARLTAVVPPAYPQETLEGLADAVVETEHRAYTLRDAAALKRLIGTLREGRYDTFIVMFDSPKLRVLATLSGAGQRYCHTVDGRFEALPRSLLRPLLSALARNLRGRLRYAYIHWIVHHRPVKQHDHDS